MRKMYELILTAFTYNSLSTAYIVQDQLSLYAAKHVWVMMKQGGQRGKQLL